MRDPNRIDKFIERFGYLWHLLPDFRFWQVVCYLCEYLPKDYQQDPFYLEDDKWLMSIELAINEIESKE